MIKLDHVVLASPKQMEFIIEFIGFLKPCMMKLICSGEANTKFSNFII